MEKFDQAQITEALDNARENGSPEFERWVESKNADAIFTDLCACDADVEGESILANREGRFDKFKAATIRTIKKWLKEHA